MKIAIIGAGKVGGALSLLLSKKGYEISMVYSRTLKSANELADLVGAKACLDLLEAVKNVDLIFITTCDKAISLVCQEISLKGGFNKGQFVFHTSGAYSSSILTGVEEVGAFSLSMHPLQSFADRNGAYDILPGSYFALEGHPNALVLGEKLVNELGGKSFRIKAEDKPLYHAGACVISNYLVSLVDLATSFYEKFGLSKEEAFEALLPLMEGTIYNISKIGVDKALTGPISRGDKLTIKEHLKSLVDIDENKNLLYRQLGIYTVFLAKRRGSLNEKEAKALEELLSY